MKTTIKLFDEEIFVSINKIFLKDSLYYFISSPSNNIIAEYFHPDHIEFINKSDIDIINREYDIANIIK